MFNFLDYLNKHLGVLFSYLYHNQVLIRTLPISTGIALTVKEPKEVIKPWGTIEEETIIFTLKSPFQKSV